MRKKIIDFSSAYAQLILLVFLPIVILAGVGAYLVEKETNKAIKSEQRTLATAALIRYEPMVKQILPTLLESQHIENQPNQDEISSLDDVKKRISAILTSMNNDLHIHRVAIIDENGKLLASSGQQNNQAWDDVKDQNLQEQQGFISGIDTLSGAAYGHLLGEYEGLSYWLFVDMDNEPLTIAQLKVWLGLGITGLFTLLMLLLSLNVYAKRWIAPTYDLRLHLQQITPENMYLPVNTDSSGELNQLQQDLVKTLRRLYGDFQELKDHSDQTEEDLRDAFDEMEMQNIFIREARDQAISSSQAKSAFLANISHELRTPLNSIDGFINLLARHGDLTAEQDLYVQTIRKSSAHLLALVNDVLDFSKIEAGKLILDKHEFSLYSAIYDVMDMLSPLAAEKGLRMAVMYYNDVPNNIIGDALRIKQVLTNLVGNAIKFTDVGEVVVRVGIDEVNDASTVIDVDDYQDKSGKQRAVELVDKNGGMIHIAIQDTGHGLSEQAKTQLFKSFSQGDPSITRQYGGTGLGLVISKQLTRLMGGKIGFYNNDNNNSAEPLTLADPSMQGASVNKPVVRTGATFWFSIPAHVEMDVPTDIEFGSNFEDVDNEEQFQLPVLRPFAQAQDSDDKPFDMLVWINHAPTIQVFMAATRPLNINVTVARSLAGALDKLKEEGKRWDWVVIDGGDSEVREDRAALLKQIRLHYQGKLAIYGYQVALDATLLERYKAGGLYQPLDKRQLYRMLDTRTVNLSTMVAPPTWQGVTILAVDDHLPNLLVLDALLSELGIKVITANSGYDAVGIISRQLVSNKKDSQQLGSIDALQEGQTVAEDGFSSQDMGQQAHANYEKIDLVFMDVQMPRMSGDEAAKKIRQLEADAQQGETAKHQQQPYKRLPIIALTAHGLEDGKERLINAGIDDYVGKPISRPQLLQILQRWLGRGGDTPVNSLRKEAQDKAIIESEQPRQIESTEDHNSEALIVDWRDALVRSANKPELAKQLLMMMQQSVPEELEALQAAWEMRDREELGQIAHRILGASRYSGVPKIRETSQDLEDKCMLNVQHMSPVQFAMLQPYYDVLVDSLEQLQALDLEAYITEQIKANEDKSLSENDMIWKMI